MFHHILREAFRCSELTAVLAMRKVWATLWSDCPSVFDLARTSHVPSNMATASAPNTNNFLRDVSCSKSRVAVTRLLRTRREVQACLFLHLFLIVVLVQFRRTRRRSSVSCKTQTTRRCAAGRQVRRQTDNTQSEHMLVQLVFEHVYVMICFFCTSQAVCAREGFLSSTLGKHLARLAVHLLSKL